jgi:hypothetical protein
MSDFLKYNSEDGRFENVDYNLFVKAVLIEINYTKQIFNR